jgi:hypothetical protein
MFISRANNIGNSDIPVFRSSIPLIHRIFHKFSRVSRKAVTREYHLLWLKQKSLSSIHYAYEKVPTHPGYPYHYGYEKASTHPGHSESLLFATPSRPYERYGVRKVSKSEIPVFRCLLFNWILFNAKLIVIQFFFAHIYRSFRIQILPYAFRNMKQALPGKLAKLITN